MITRDTRKREAIVTSQSRTINVKGAPEVKAKVSWRSARNNESPQKWRTKACKEETRCSSVGSREGTAHLHYCVVTRESRRSTGSAEWGCGFLVPQVPNERTKPWHETLGKHSLCNSHSVRQAMISSMRACHVPANRSSQRRPMDRKARDRKMQGMKRQDGLI